MQTLESERELRAAGQVVRLPHVTSGHTDNGVIVRIPRLNIVHVGDLLFNKHHTFVDASAGATTVGWDRSLAAAIAMCTRSTIVVGGHGPVTDRAGRTRADVIALRTAAVADLAWPELLGQTLGVIYDELTAKR